MLIWIMENISIQLENISIQPKSRKHSDKRKHKSRKNVTSSSDESDFPAHLKRSFTGEEPVRTSGENKEPLEHVSDS